MPISSRADPSIARLAAILLRWQSRRASEVAAAAQVDKGNLSRWLGGKPRAGVGSATGHAILLTLGWGALGPLPSQVHNWCVDGPRDVEWVFGELLGGRAKVGPLSIASQGGLAYDDRELLPHLGVLIAEYNGAWLVLTESLTDPDQAVRCESPLDLLLDPRTGLASQTGGEYEVATSNAFESIVGGEVSPKALARMVAEPGKPDVLLQDAAVLELNEHLDSWLSEDELKTILGDAHVRKCRAEFDSMVELAHANLIEQWTESNLRAPSQADVVRLRQLAEQLVLEVARQPYSLDWGHADKA
jgi:hypothetical protein